MRIVYDHGMGPRIAGMHRALPGEKTEVEKVLVIRASSEDHGADDPAAVKPQAARDGMPVPGTDLMLTVSDAARFRDAEVRSHERAHLYALGGAAASAVQLQTQTGPDGKRYATGGAIKADLSQVPGDPQATLKKARQVIRAAYAPGNPSAADMRVAADAYRLAKQAKDELGGNSWYA